ncbi:thioesterase domain-containing protein [Burkholderia ubonensis]|uniref:thioesterase domain-containing protein n=1 Tax=Burkholderia ubonensis TaxID=101571 RepID=UPI000A73E42A|nr:thioesterase domain-containing protein [Burkholderia ubonensis]
MSVSRLSSECSIVGDEAALAALEVRSQAHGVFWIAGHERLPDGARRVAEQLGAGWRVRELDADPPDEPPPTVEWLAARLLEQIVARQPRGPYRLAGWSSGGLLAYEVATQLIGRDETVEFLGIAGAPLPAANAGARLAESIAHRGSGRAGDPGWAESALDHAFAHYEPFSLSIPVHVFELRSAGTVAAAPSEATAGWLARLPNGRLHRIDAPARHDAPSAVAQAFADAIAHALRDARRAADSTTTDRVRHAPERHYQPHLPIQRGAPGRGPIVVIPGAGDNVATFLPFAIEVDPAWPIHGLQPRGLDGVLVPHASVAAAAAAYLPVVERLAADAREPVHLIGHSFGGWVAMALACRLQASGRPPASLTIVDTEAPASGGRLGRQYTFTSVVWNLVRALETATGRPLGIAHDALLRADRAGQWAMLHRGMVDARIIRGASGPRDLQGIVRAYGTALRTGYDPAAVYAGDVTLVLAADFDDAEHRLAPDDVLAGWRRFAPRIALWRCPGNHYTMIRPPYVEHFAQWWQQRARGDSGMAAASAPTPARDLASN